LARENSALAALFGRGRASRGEKDGRVGSVGVNAASLGQRTPRGDFGLERCV
jgi:hypothetical protein